MFNCIELACFTVGLSCILGKLPLIIIITIIVVALRILKLLINPFIKTKATTKRYGEKSYAVITGGANGIGEAMARELANRNFNLVLIDLDQKRLVEVSKSIQEKNKVAVLTIVYDFGKETTPTSFEKLTQKFSDLDVSILINNVGVCNPANLFAEIETKRACLELLVNCYPVVMLSKFMIERLRQRYQQNKKRSLIMNVASTCGIMYQPYCANYCGTKVFTKRFSQSLYYELNDGISGIDVVTLAPSSVSTNLSKLQEGFAVISPQMCAIGALNNITAFEQNGGWQHEILAFFIRLWLVDFLPRQIAGSITLKLGQILRIVQQKAK
ncbi:estradiol 17-beta- [Stylonychia lemnae]|uniref:Estradiol 17-beta n=1 Tax=Stylonychia lemnae TaxID=5949 RepID=A0A078AQE0_STYLE|nr:estradiol 17-beta- [Stylonychia lemnae]|eukprot:CDW84166.1 estradiol 17-beta- [Stylonychia lemnae]